MADVLKMIGLGAAQPNPTAYTNQKEVANQVKEAKANLKSQMDNLSLLIDAAELTGTTGETLDTMKEIKAEGDVILNDPNTTPETIEKKRAELEAKLTATQEKSAAETKVRTVKQTQDAVDAIEKRIKEVQADGTTSKAMLDRYNELLKTAKATLEEAKKMPDKPKKPTEPIQPPEITPAMLAVRLDDLNMAKEDEENKEFNMKRFVQRLLKRMAYGMFLFSVLLGGALGGIILANRFAVEPFWGIKAFYFVYGAAFFPATLLLGCFDPPNWYATILPVYARQEAEPAGIVDRLFSYVSMDPPTAAELRPPERKKLRVISIVTTSFLAIVAWYYDVIGYLKKGG